MGWNLTTNCYALFSKKIDHWTLKLDPTPRYFYFNFDDKKKKVTTSSDKNQCFSKLRISWNGSKQLQNNGLSCLLYIDLYIWIRSSNGYEYYNIIKTEIKKKKTKTKKTPRISGFSAYALTTFREYTAWAAFGGVSWKWPKVTFYMSISIMAYLISQLEQICKWGIKYVHLVMTDHVGSTCAHHYPHTKFHRCSPYRTLDI